MCDRHGANTAQTRGKAERAAEEEQVAKAEAKALKLFGGDSQAMDHREAALAEVGTRYYAVLWFRQEIAALESLADRSERGESAHTLLSLLALREKRLDEILRLCHDMKIDQQTADRELRNADRMDLLVHALLQQLGLDPNVPEVRQAVRGALLVLDGGVAS